MIFNTWIFCLFGIVVFMGYWYAIPTSWRPAYLVVAGTIFYAASIPVYTLLVFSLATVTYVALRLLVAPAVPHTYRRGAFVLGVLASVGVLGLFKYSRLFASTFKSVCHGTCAISLPNLIVPLAVSFFTFEFVHVLTDAYLGKIKSARFRDFWVFAMFFPTMVAGPIKRYQNFVPQIDRVIALRRLDPALMATGTYRVVLGLAKKSIIADSMTPLVAPLLAPGPVYTTADYWAGALAYAAKIYFDFSGYSDIAIGCSLLLGFQILENFDRPYWSENISIFWRRWHMSLSSWIRDYLFIPLGGSRRGALFTLLNLAVVMAIAGLWHGAAWHFVAWGLWQGAGLAVHRAWSSLVSRRLSQQIRTASWLRGVSIVTTFAFVVFGWVLFASPDTKTALHVMERMFGIGAA